MIKKKNVLNLKLILNEIQLKKKLYYYYYKLDLGNWVKIIK